MSEDKRIDEMTTSEIQRLFNVGYSSAATIQGHALRTTRPVLAPAAISDKMLDAILHAFVGDKEGVEERVRDAMYKVMRGK